MTLPPPAVDLATLLGEMAALKTEVRAETRAARDLREHLARTRVALEGELARGAAREERLRADAEELLREERRRAAQALLAVLDRIEALEGAARRAPARGIWPFRRVDPALAATAEGLGLTAARVIEALAGLGVTRITAVGAPLDPHRMEAVGTASAPLPDLQVTEELVSGWMEGDRVLRLAQVVVNRAQPPDREQR